MVPKSTVLATRHEPPCPCTVTGCASGRSSLRASRHRAASPKMCRTESHRHASRPVVPPSRAACRRLTHRADWFGSPLLWKCSVPQAGLRTKARWRRRTPGPGKARANRSTSFRRLSRVLLAAPTRKKCSATHEAREKGEPACAAEGSVYEPPAALIAAWLERVRGNTVRRKRRTRFLPSRENSALESDANQRKRGVVSVCRLRRNQAGRAARVGESWPLFPALLWTAAIAW